MKNKIIKKSIFLILLILITKFSYGQSLALPSIWGSSEFKQGTGDGVTMTTYNTFLNLHYGLGIGSPYVDNGNGGYINKATIVFDGRKGDINSIGRISSNFLFSNAISSPSITSSSNFYFPTYNNYTSNYFFKGTGDGASLTTYNTIIKLHTGLAIGSPFVSDGNGGFVDKATIVFDGRTGNIISRGVIESNRIHTSEVKVDLNVAVPDYVFAEDYKLKSLEEVEDYIKQNKHLPEIPSANEIDKNGLMLAEMNMNLLKKMEEMTLYMIEQQKKSKEQAYEIDTLKKENQVIKLMLERISKLENQLKK